MQAANAHNDSITARFNTFTFANTSLVFFPVLSYFALIKFYGVNAPWFDDVQDILQFMLAFDDADNGWDKFILLFKQHNQHRTAVSHVIYLLQYHLFGQLNFVGLMLLANLAAAGILFAYYYLFRDSPLQVLVVIVAALLIFQPHAYHAMFWAMAALSAYLVLVFAFWSFVCLNNGTFKSTLLAGVFACLAIFSNSNGIFIPVAVLFVFILRVIFDRRTDRELNYPLLALYLVVCALSLLWFFHDYNAGNSLLHKLLQQVQNPYWLIVNFCFLVGAGYSFDAFYPGAVLGGVGLLLSLGLLRKRYYLRQPAMFAFLLFLLLSLGAVAVVRGQPERPLMIMSSHYYQLSMLIWVIIVIAYIDLYMEALTQLFRSAPQLLVAVMVVFCIGSYVVQVPKVVAACMEKKSWIYEFNKRLLDGSVMRSSWDKVVLDSLQRGYFDANPGLKEYRLPFLSAKQSCYIGGWK